MRDLQLALFRGPQARSTDPVTSHAAAANVDIGIGAEILNTFAVFGHLTDDELVDAMPARFGPTTKTARSRLTKLGYLVDSGDRRPSRRGMPSIVWRHAT